MRSPPANRQYNRIIFTLGFSGWFPLFATSRIRGKNDREEGVMFMRDLTPAFPFDTFHDRETSNTSLCLVTRVTCH